MQKDHKTIYLHFWCDAINSSGSSSEMKKKRKLCSKTSDLPFKNNGEGKNTDSN